MHQRIGRSHSKAPRAVLAAAAAVVVSAMAPSAALAATTPQVATPTISGGTTPVANSTVGPNPRFSFASSTGSVTYMCQMDFATLAICTSPKAYTNLAGGAHTFKVVATKTGYTQSSTAQLAFTVDATAPGAPTLSGAPSTYTNETSASISVTAAEAGGTFTCSVDGGTYSACTSPVALTGLADGLHSLAVKQTDAYGNTGTAATTSWTVDTTAPGSVSGWSGLVGKVVTNAAISNDSTVGRIDFTLPEAVDGLDLSKPVECRIDSGGWNSCWSVSGTSGYHFVGSSLSGGSHTLSIRLTDLAGNVSAVSTSPSWTVDDGTLKLHDTGFGTMAVDGCQSVCPDSVVIPDKWGSKNVVEISTQAFLNTGITSITLPNTLNTIWSHAFEGTKLTSIVLPGTLKTIADWAFKGTSITSLTIPTSVTSLGAGAFSQMTDLTSVSMPAGITEIPNFLFSESTNLTSFSIPYTVRSIGQYAFSGTGLSSVTLPLSFDGTIADGAFSSMPNLTKVTWLPYPGSKITSIGYLAFGDSRSLATIPNLVGGTGGLASIGAYAFYNTAIASLTIPDGVTSIGEGAFYNTPITSITVPNSVTSLGDSVFCRASSLASVTLPTGLKSIGNQLFWGASSLTAVTIPSGVTSIGNGAFQGTGITSVTIPSGVTAIGESVFEKTHLAAVTVPSGVKSIGPRAFAFINELANVTLPNTLKTMDQGAFAGDLILEAVTIPSSVTSIGDLAFYNNFKLANVRFEGNAPTVGADAFTGVKSGALATLSSTTLTGYGFNGDKFNGLTVTGGIDPADTTPPTTPGSFTGVPSSPTNATGATIGFTLGESGGTVSCRVDSGSWGECGSVSATTGSYTVASLADGSHTVSVRQTDAAGNVSQVGTSESWTVDATAPAAPSLGGVPTGSTTATSASITFSGEAGGSFECSVDVAAYAPCTSPKALSSLTVGSHSLAVRQIDAAGNTGSSATASWTVSAPAADTTPPTTPGSFTGVPGSLTNQTAATIGFTLGESGGTVECRVDSGSWGSCTSVSGTSGSHAVSGLADGSHTVSVRQTDAAGNVSQIGTSGSWTVDATAPAAPSLSGAPSGSTVSATASIAFSGESPATFTCSIDGGSYAPCTSPLALSGLGVGSHSVAVKQTDAAGNTGAATTASWTVLAVSAPTIQTPAAGVKTIVRDDVNRKWVIKVGLLFSTGGDVRSAAQFLTLQVAVDSAGKPVTAKPADGAPFPTAPSASQGVANWTGVGDAAVSYLTQPTWVRVQNKAGKWSGWVKLAP